MPQRQYPHGYRVSVTGASVVSKPGAQLLLLRASRPGPVVVRVSPA